MLFPEGGAVMPGRHWTMPAGAAYGPAVTHSPAPSVVTVGPLMPDLVAALAERYAARPLESLGGEGGAGVRVAVTTGRTGVRADTLDRLPDLGAVVHFVDEPHVPAALLDRDDVVLLPHLASGTVETRAAMRDLVLANVASFLDDGRLVTPLG